MVIWLCQGPMSRFRYKAIDEAMATYYFVVQMNPYFPEDGELMVVSILRADDPLSPSKLREIYKRK